METRKKRGRPARIVASVASAADVPTIYPIDNSGRQDSSASDNPQNLVTESETSDMSKNAKAKDSKVWGHDDICAVIEKYQTRENPATQVFCNATFEFVTTSIAGVAVHKSEDNVIVLSTGEKIEF